MSVFLTVDTTVAVCDAFNAVQEEEAKEGSSATTLTDRPCSEICEKDLASAAVLR
ncbi:hypothetical protein PC128_g20279 [Phytophthora cactorum]|nr:hypothetical protein PC128_g20279 [Phytophthora cactorum]